MDKIHQFYSLVIISGLLFFASINAYGEVIDLRTDSKSYSVGDQLTFSGNVEHGNSGIVSIVIRDSNDNFVLLTQAITDQNYFFKKTIKLNDKFTETGTYNATGFILNMTAGKITQFDISNKETVAKEPLHPVQEPINDSTDNDSQNTVTEEKTTHKPTFIDENIDPIHYVNRYYNEPDYKEWFDRNYPDYTIEEAVGYENLAKNTQTTQKDLIPKAQAISTTTSVETDSDNGEFAQIVLAVAALGILFGATYGIKRKVDDNSKQISINTDIIRKKIIKPIIGSNPLDVLQMRLVKGEITLEEYNLLKKEIKSN